jgi:glycosyltransferase involved in cell wall biosynthesis
VPSVLHILPHRGGGAERYIDLLESMPGYVHERAWLSASRTPLSAAPSILARRPGLWRAARRHDLIHLHGDVTAMLCVSLLRRHPGLVSTHGLSFLRRASGVPLRIARARWMQVAHCARRVVCSSQAEHDELLLLQGDGGAPLTVVPNGIALPQPPDADRRRAVRAELGIAEQEVVGLYLGLLDRYKDPLTAVNATLAVRARGIPLTLLLAGDGPLLDAVRGGAGPGVRVLGFREDPEPLLGAADVFVMPSRREGSSYALLEAMGYGLAIVASDGAGIPEMLGTAGIVAPVGDVQSFTDALASLACDRSYRERLGQSARDRAKRCYGIDRFTASMRTLYDAVLSERKTR